jgi:adenylyltransferase/sulfurtransferase
MVLPEMGSEGQRRLKAARVLCIGAGGLGSPAALYLAAAGVGRLGIVDPDRVEVSNLQRQILHATQDAGSPKAESALARLSELNPEIDIRVHPERFAAANAASLVEGYDLVVDGTDNFSTRYLSNDVCFWAGIPNVYGSVYRFEGQCSVFAPSLGGPCYRCMFPSPPPPGDAPSCAEAGVLGVLPGLIGTLQATEALKLILGLGEPLVGRLLHFDALTCRMREFRLRKNPGCPLCGERPTITAPSDLDAACGAPGGGGPGENLEIGPEELKRRLDAGEEIVLLDVREPDERMICSILPSVLIPLGQLPERLSEIPRDAPVVVYCKLGIRSGRALALLRRAGFEGARHLEGGILAWADAVDPRMPRY